MPRLLVNIEDGQMSVDIGSIVHRMLHVLISLRSLHRSSRLSVRSMLPMALSVAFMDPLV